jgi:hypothetical protein
MEYFKSLKTYDEIQQLIFAHIYRNNLDAKTGYLLLELKDEVLLRVVDQSLQEFCEACTEDLGYGIFFEEIKESGWKDGTEELRGPERFSGDIRLVKFKVGF